MASTEPREPGCDAFVTAFIRHQRQIYAFIGALLPHQVDLDDVFQQTSLRLWQKRESYDPDRPFLPWAYGFARNEVFNFLRSQSRGTVRLNPKLLEQIAEVRAVNEGQAASRRAALEACVQRLSPSQQELLRARYEGKASLKEHAEALSTTAAALTMRLQRIRHALLRCIEATIAGGIH